ncbi:MAG: glycosyltransferase family 2 protein [Myxococcota bacterium]
MKPKLSVIVVSFQSRTTLEPCLGSVVDADELILVDNASADGTVEWVREKFPEVEVIAFPENRGFSAAVNAGAARATGDALLLLNPDAALNPGQVAQMRGRLEEHASVAAFGFRQLDQSGFFQLAHGGRAKLLDELLRMLAQRALDARWASAAWAVDAAFSRPADVPWVAGSCLLVRREFFDRVNGFDEGFFLFFEDIDFCLRLADVGGRVRYDPTLTVLHHRGVSAAKVPTESERWYRESQRRFWRKHRGVFVETLVRGYQSLRHFSNRVSAD